MPKLKVSQQQSTNATPKSKKGESQPKKREIIYPQIEATVYADGMSIGPVTSKLSKELLGWEEEEEKKPFGNKHVAEISRQYGTKVRCANNVTNRPIYSRVVATLKQEILRGRWVFNGEPIIIGLTGLVLNGQHTLLALIFAAKEWQEHPDDYPAWTKEPTLDKMVVFGVAENDSTVNTMDTCKPRTLTEVIYRAAYFNTLKDKAQRDAAKMCDNAIKMLWHKTGLHGNAFAFRRTHSESIAFLERHPKLLECVKHIYEENAGSKADGNNKIGMYLAPGYASAAMFLMATDDSDPQTYYGADNPGDDCLEWSHWDRAQEFFVELASGSAGFKPVRDAISKLISEGAGRVHERWGVIVKAWGVFVSNKPIKDKDVKLDFEVKDGERHLKEELLFGGIDVGEDADDFATGPEPETDKQEVEERKAKVQEKKNGKPKVAKRKGKTWAKGDTAWVHASEGTYFATLKDDPYECIDGPNRVMVDSDEGEWEVEVHNLSLKEFEFVK